jgi:Argonaute linker 1 domain
MLTFHTLAIMVLDVLIRHLPSMTYATVGRSFFTPQDAKPLANGAEVWQGFYQSARPAVGMLFFLMGPAISSFKQPASDSLQIIMLQVG